MGEQFQNWIENIIQTRLNQELDAKVEHLEEKIKVNLKNEKEELSKQSNVAFEQNCQLIEQKLTLKFEEMIETKLQAFSDKFHAQLFKELKQVTRIIQLEMDNFDKYVEEKLNGKFETYLKEHQQEIDKVLVEEINQKMQDSMTKNEQYLKNVLENKINLCLKDVLEVKYRQINLKLDKQVNNNLKEILNKKMRLLTLTSDENTFEDTEAPETTSNSNLNYEQKNYNSDEVQKTVNDKGYENRFENIDGKIKALEQELRQKKEENKEYEQKCKDLYSKINELEIKLNTVDKEPRGKYTNWELKHESLKRHSFVSTTDFWNTLNTIEKLHGSSSVQNSEIVRVFNSMTIHRVTKTKRFPVGDTFIDLNDPVVATCIADFYECLKNLSLDRLKDSCNSWAVIGKIKLLIELPEHKEAPLYIARYSDYWISDSSYVAGRIVKGIPKFDVIKFEEVNDLIWLDSSDL